MAPIFRQCRPCWYMFGEGGLVPFPSRSGLLLAQCPFHALRHCPASLLPVAFRWSYIVMAGGVQSSYVGNYRQITKPRLHQ